MSIWKLQRSGILNARNNESRQKPRESLGREVQDVPNLSSCLGDDSPRGTKRTYETTSSDEENSYRPTEVRPMKIFKSVQEPATISAESLQIIEKPKRPSVIVEQQQKSPAVNKGDPELEKLINQRLNMVFKLQQQHFETMKLINEKLNALNETPNNSSILGAAENVEEEFTLPEPMQTAVELDTMNQNLRVNPEFREQTVQILVGIGGHDMKQAIRLMMDRLVHDNLAAQFSFFGKRGKFTFAAYSAICAVILQSCRRNPNIGEKANAMDLKIHLADYLKNASDRVINRLKKLHSQYESTHFQ